MKKYYVIAGGCDCDGTRVRMEDVVSEPYDSKEAAETACEKACESSDGVYYTVMDEDRVNAEYALELAASLS